MATKQPGQQLCGGIPPLPPLECPLGAIILCSTPMPAPVSLPQAAGSQAPP